MTNTISILENIKKKIAKLDQPHPSKKAAEAKEEAEDFGSFGEDDDFEYISEDAKKDDGRSIHSDFHSDKSTNDVMMEHEIENSFADLEDEAIPQSPVEEHHEVSLEHPDKTEVEAEENLGELSQDGDDFAIPQTDEEPEFVAPDDDFMSEEISTEPSPEAHDNELFNEELEETLEENKPEDDLLDHDLGEDLDLEVHEEENLQENKEEDHHHDLDLDGIDLHQEDEAKPSNEEAEEHHDDDFLATDFKQDENSIKENDESDLLEPLPEEVKGESENKDSDLEGDFLANEQNSHDEDAQKDDVLLDPISNAVEDGLSFENDEDILEQKPQDQASLDQNLQEEAVVQEEDKSSKMEVEATKSSKVDPSQDDELFGELDKEQENFAQNNLPAASKEEIEFLDIDNKDEKQDEAVKSEVAKSEIDEDFDLENPEIPKDKEEDKEMKMIDPVEDSSDDEFFDEIEEESESLQNQNSDLLNESLSKQVSESINNLVEAKNMVKKVDEYSKESLLDDVARDLMKPQLEKWMNANLPQLVEKIVREEIKKIVDKK